MISPAAHAAILRKVAWAAVGDARAAWARARASPTEKRVRAAFRACVFASMALHKAAKVTPNSAELLAEAKLINAAGDELKDQLVRIVEA